MRTRAMYSNIEDRLKLHERLLAHQRAVGWSRHVLRRSDTLMELNFWIVFVVPSLLLKWRNAPMSVNFLPTYV